MNQFGMMIYLLLLGQVTNCLASVVNNDDEASYAEARVIDIPDKAEKESFEAIWQTATELAGIIIREQLDPEVAEWIANPEERIIANNGYLYLLSQFTIGEAAGLSGEALHHMLSRGQTGQTISRQRFHAMIAYRIPDFGFPCDGYNQGCLDKLQGNETLAETLLKQQNSLHIYQQFLTREVYQEVPAVEYGALSPQFELLRILSALFHSQLLNQASPERQSWLTERLLTEHTGLRRMLASTDEPFARIMLTVLLRNNLKLISLFDQVELMDVAALHKNLLPMKAHELDLRALMKSKVTASYVQLLEFQQQQLNNSYKDHPVSAVLQQTIIDGLSNPVVSINHHYRENVKPVMAMLGEGPESAPAHLQQFSFAQVPDSLDNRLGKYHSLILEFTDLYLESQVNTYDLAMNINLVRAMATCTVDEITTDACAADVPVRSLYDQGLPKVVNGALCHESPLRKWHNQSCVVVLNHP